MTGVVTPIVAQGIGAAKLARRVRKKNPATLVPNHPDPARQNMSATFHGRRGAVVRLTAEQRRPPPEHAVLIGEERATVYQPPRGSHRAGAVWEHAAGDVGDGKPRKRGKRLIVADARGNVFTVPGSSRMKFVPTHGLVG